MTEKQEKLSSTKENHVIPALYSKRLILIFSILFSTLFASFLLMSNFKAVGKERARIGVLIFAVLFTIGTGLLLQVSNLEATYTVIANVIGAAILNEFFWNRYIGADLEFRKKSWVKPALISLAIALVLFFLLMQAS